MVIWHSESKGDVEVATMNVFHARAALAKLDRGDYFGADGNPPSVQEHISLRSELQRRIAQVEEAQSSNEGGPDV